MPFLHPSRQRRDRGDGLPVKVESGFDGHVAGDQGDVMGDDCSYSARSATGMRERIRLTKK